jgi:hypothetical protein
MDVAGLLLIALAAADHIFFRVPVQGGFMGSFGAYVQDLADELVGSFGILLLLGRPLLRLRWWESWIYFSFAGILLVAANFIGASSIQYGLSCLMMAVVFSIAQWLVRQAEPKAADAPQDKHFLWKSIKP